MVYTCWAAGGNLVKRRRSTQHCAEVIANGANIGMSKPGCVAQPRSWRNLQQHDRGSRHSLWHTNASGARLRLSLWPTNAAGARPLTLRPRMLANMY